MGRSTKTRELSNLSPSSTDKFRIMASHSLKFHTFRLDKVNNKSNIHCFIIICCFEGLLYLSGFTISFYKWENLKGGLLGFSCKNPHTLYSFTLIPAHMVNLCHDLLPHNKRAHPAFYPLKYRSKMIAINISKLFPYGAWKRLHCNQSRLTKISSTCFHWNAQNPPNFVDSK